MVSYPSVTAPQTNPENRTPMTLDTAAPLAPTTEDALADAIRSARADRTPLELAGNATKRGWGRPVQAARRLDVSGLTGITLYRPTELILQARAGTPLPEIQAALDEAGQALPFEPADWRHLYGTEDRPQTIGGITACNLSGPARVNAGALRDHLIGIRAVNGSGEVIRSGGRVMKNVTGYDLAKLAAGSFGTLCALTEVTFKLLPGAKRTATLCMVGLDDVRARAALSAALGSPFELTGAAHLPAWAAATSSLEPVRGAGGPVTAVRLQGFADSVAYRVAELTDLLAAYGVAFALDTAPSETLWREIRDLRPFAETGVQPLWRLSVAPTRGPETVAAIAADLPVRALYDWGGGLVWLLVEAELEDGGANAVRTAVAAVDGHATLIRGPEPLRAAVPPFQPQPLPLAELSRRVKQTFDPGGLFNPGRMAPDL